MPDDYIAGFPAHPHRGFETVTYMLDGHMRHEDHLGHVGELESGGVQWMTAGRGIIHSEMPQQEQGRMRGFQLWVNLPANEKMKPAAYRDIPADGDPRGRAAERRYRESGRGHTRRGRAFDRGSDPGPDDRTALLRHRASGGRECHGADPVRTQCVRLRVRGQRRDRTFAPRRASSARITSASWLTAMA